jgi:pimeloyl-ACP methyl ester carboxylesterase
MPSAISSDGTSIAYEQIGTGPSLVLVDGALCHRTFGPSAKLARELAPRFTVYVYDRRGRGVSGDGNPYAVEREVEDLAAVIERAGGSAFVYGCSTGAHLALDAASRLSQIERLAVYEPPIVVDPSGNVLPADFLERLEQHLSVGRRSAAVKQFLTHVGTPRPAIAVMRRLPVWSKLTAVAHTLPYDIALLGDTNSGRSLSTDRWSTIAAPTLVMHGGKSPHWMAAGVTALAAALGGVEHRVLERQTHMVKPGALAPALTAHFDTEPGPDARVPHRIRAE